MKTIKLLTLFFLFFTFAIPLYPQNIIVNPDGTHSLVHMTGDVGMISSPSGTISTIHKVGDSGIIINSDGTHSIIHFPGNTGIIINPQLNVNHLHPDMLDIIKDEREKNEENYFQDMNYSEYSSMIDEGLLKLKILKKKKVIKYREYTKLKKLLFLDPQTVFGFYDAYVLFMENKLSEAEFKYRKQVAIDAANFVCD